MHSSHLSITTHLFRRSKVRCMHNRQFVRLAVFAFTAFASMRGQSSDDKLISHIKAAQSSYSDLSLRENLQDRVIARNNDYDFVRPSYSHVPEASSWTKDDPESLTPLKALLRRSEVVVIGEAVRVVSSFTADKSYIFSETEFSVDSVLISKPGVNHIDRGEKIFISSPGGVVRAAGHRISVREPELTLMKPSHTYLLLLRLNRQSGSYQMPNGVGFDLSGDKILSLNRDFPVPYSNSPISPSLFRNRINSLVGASSVGADLQ